MTDLKLAAQKAVLAALNVSAVTSLAPVHQHAPDDTQPPVVIIGDMNAEAVGGKDGQFDRIDFEVISLVRAPGREHLTPVMAAVRAQLDEQALSQAEAALSPPRFEGDSDEILEDGNTYLGVQRFSLFAQPLD